MVFISAFDIYRKLLSIQLTELLSCMSLFDKLLDNLTKQMTYDEWVKNCNNAMYLSQYITHKKMEMIGKL